MTDIRNQNPTSDQDNRLSSTQSGSVQNYDPSVHLPAQAAGTQVDPFASGQPPKGKRRGKKPNKGQQEAAFANSQDQSADGQGAEKASGGGGSGNTLLYVAGGLGIVGAGVALAGGGGSSAPETPKDTTPPTAPTAALATDTGSSSSDRITSNGRIDVGGLETGATWEYSTNGGTSWQAGSGTSFTLTAGSYADGAVLVRQKDAAGNVSANGKPAGAVTVDATAPSAAVIAQVAVDGTVSAAEKEAGITVTGTGEAGSSVSVVWGTVTKTTTVGSTNSWSVQFASADVPADGATTVRVTLTDPAGNASAAAERAVTVDTKIAIQGSIVAGPLVAGHGLTVSLYTSDGKLLQSGVAVANDGSFSARVAAKKGDVLIAKVTDSGAGADYADEASGASKDLNAALFATVIVSDLSAPVQAQINPVTTLAAIKAGLSADGSGTVKDAAAVRDANALVAKAFGLDDVNVAPVATNGGAFNSADGLSAAEKLGAVLAALSGIDGANGGDSQKTLTALSGQIGASGAALSAAGQADLLAGAAAASLRADGKLESTISDLLAKSQQSAEVSIDAVATDNIVSSAEVGSLTLTGTVAAGATSVVVALGSATGTATIDGTKWTYSVTSSDVAALGSDGAIILSVTANFEGGVSKTAARPILLDTQGPEAPKVNAVAGDNYVNAAEAGKVTLSGTAEPGSKLFLNWGGKDLSVTAGVDGKWTIDVPAAGLPADGSSALKAYAVDVNGNRGAEVSVPVTIDRARPNKPLIDVVSGDDRLSSVEAAKTITLKGTAEAGSKIFLSWGGTKEFSDIVPEGGAWSVTVLAADIPKAGASQITAYVVDPAGNRSEAASRDVTIYGALTKPIIFPIAVDNQVNSPESLDGVVVSGLAPPLSLIRLTWGNGQTVKSDENGDWSATFGLTDLPIDGSWTVRAELVDEFDVPLGPTQTVELPVIIDTIAPDAATLGLVAENNIVNAQEKGDGIRISGSAEPLSKITLIWGNTTKFATVREDRSWDIDLIGNDIPPDGTVPIQVISKDAAGNSSIVTSRDIKVDTLFPDAPKVRLRADTGLSNSDNITNDGLLLLTGIEPDAIWSYSVDSGENWRIGGTASNAQLSLSRGEYETGQILIRQEDAAGNVSPVYSNNSLITVDTSTDQIIVESITENLGSTAIVNADEKARGVTITGSFEPFSLIEVNWNGVVKSPNGPADGDGNWSVTFSSSEIPTDGSTSVIIKGTDVAGNIAQRTVAVIVDTQAPDVLSIGLLSDTNIPNDGITGNRKIAVTGFEANSSWEYSVNGGETWEEGGRILSGSSSFDLDDGTYANGVVRVRQVDAGGNVGQETSLSGNIIVDTTAEGLTIGAVAGDNIVNLTERGGRVSVSGQAEIGATVAVTLAGVTTQTEAGAGGQWTVNYDALASLVDGEYEISVVQTDLAGNVSAPVKTTFTIDTTRPANPTLAAVTGDNKINAADLAGLTLSGTAVANGKVRLNWGTGDVIVDVDREGKWETLWELAKLPEDGSRTLAVTAINPIGNISQTIERIVTIDRQVLPPTVESIAGDDKVNAAEKAQGVTVTGLAEGGAAVTIVWGGVSKTVQAASNGQWTTYFGPTEIPADGSTTMILSQIDVLGNVSSPRIVRPIVDTGLPASPTISAIANDDILVPSERTGNVLVSGSGEANAKVIVTFAGVSQEVTVGPQRSWTAEFAGSSLPASGDTQVTAQVKDSSGNLSEVTSRIVTFVSGEVTAPVIGPISTDNAINAAEKSGGVRISGLAAANDVVEVQIGTSPSKFFTTGASGAWSVSFGAAELPVDGTYTVTATSQKGTGSRQLVLDASAPLPAIITPVATDGVVDGLEKAQGITITGTAEAGAQVSVLWAGLRKAATLSGTTWSASFAPNEIAGDSSSVAQVTVRDAAGNQSTASTNIIVASTPHLAIAKAGVIAATAEMFGLSDTATSASTVSISVSGLSNGAFSKSGVAASSFTLQAVKDGLVLFTHNGSDAAPAYSVALSSAGVSTSAKAAYVAFATGGTDGADTLSGTSAADLLIGMGGDDVIMGGAGNDILYGRGTGATGLASDNDVFKWAAGDAGTGALDVIRDFNVWNGTSGDKLDIAGLLQGFAGSGQSLDKWVTVQDNVTPSNLSGWDATRSGTLITIDLDGPGAGTISQSIFLEGVSLGSGNVNTLVSTGVIIA